MLPAFAGRLQNLISLEPLQNAKQAQDLAAFYFDHARRESEKLFDSQGVTPGSKELISSADIAKRFEELLEISAAEKGLEGVSQRDFLNSLHELAERKFGHK